MRIKVVRKPNGKTYLYRRDNMAPLPNLPENHPDLLRAYVEAESYRKPGRGLERIRQGTIADFLHRYMASPVWAELSQGTRDSRRRIIAKLEASDLGRHGRFVDLEARHIRADLAQLAADPANNRLKVWRALCNWAEDEGLVPEGQNAARAVRKRRTRATPYRRWSRDHVALFRRRWPIGTPQRLAGEVLYWSGARCIDARLLGGQMLDRHGFLVFTQHKTGGQAMVPWSVLPAWAEPLRGDWQQLHACLEGHANLTFIVTERGAPRSQKGLSQWFARAARDAGLPAELTAHGLRKSRTSELAELGATSLQIGSWTGHASLAEIESYQREAERDRAMRGDGTKPGRMGNRSGNSPGRKR